MVSPMNVPYFDLTTQYAQLRSEICAALDRVCQNASFILGEEVTRFEPAFASDCEVKHYVSLNSGTSASASCFVFRGNRPRGDEVITNRKHFHRDGGSDLLHQCDSSVCGY